MPRRYLLVGCWAVQVLLEAESLVVLQASAVTSRSCEGSPYTHMYAASIAAVCTFQQIKRNAAGVRPAAAAGSYKEEGLDSSSIR